MRESWSFVGGDKHTPKLGDPSLDASRKIITVPVQLKPNWTYRYWLNSDRFKNFASAEGIPLRPVKVEFKTGE